MPNEQNDCEEDEITDLDSEAKKLRECKRATMRDNQHRSEPQGQDQQSQVQQFHRISKKTARRMIHWKMLRRL
jgi:hypothetical protein